jgi:hypothetical protein
MKIISIAAGISASLLAGSAYAGTVARLGSALPLTSVGLVGIATVVLIAGVRILRRKQDK